MADLIKLLPDKVANQIAAGEVVQRPASAVKELLENAVDAGATQIQLIVKDAGKTLIQVIDNGCGMGTLDARMCFERHATSKIKQAEDLFAIRTKGFRGEALASIAAVAQVELKSRQPDLELGTMVRIEGSEVKTQEPTATPGGTSIAVKNLFYNIPARRNFLKSDTVEMRHILSEFERVALAHPNIRFQLFHNGNELHSLPGQRLRQRIVKLFGNRYDERLVPVEEETTALTIRGYIGKPEYARKTRGEQFFFVNNRFIKSSALHFAVVQAYTDVVSRDSHPAYFIFLEIDPSEIDINIHPTKTEIKFRDERLVYAMLNSAVKRALGKHSLTPSLDFESETAFNFVPPPTGAPVRAPEIPVDPEYNPFQPGAGKSQAPPRSSAVQRAGWESLYHPTQPTEAANAEGNAHQPNLAGHNTVEMPAEESGQGEVLLVQGKYVVATLKSGLVVIDRHRAYERLFYERALRQLARPETQSQQLLFPHQMDLTPANTELIRGMMPELRTLGFEIEEFGKQTFVIRGVPASLEQHNAIALLESTLEAFKHELFNEKEVIAEKLARAFARSMAQSRVRSAANESHQLIDQLFACRVPHYTPTGKPVFVTFTPEDLANKFER